MWVANALTKWVAGVLYNMMLGGLVTCVIVSNNLKRPYQQTIPRKDFRNYSLIDIVRPTIEESRPGNSHSKKTTQYSENKSTIPNRRHYLTFDEKATQLLKGL